MSSPSLGTADLRNADVPQKSSAYYTSLLVHGAIAIPIKGHHTWRWPHVKHALCKQETEFGVPGMDRSRVIQSLRI